MRAHKGRFPGSQRAAPRVIEKRVMKMTSVFFMMRCRLEFEGIPTWGHSYQPGTETHSGGREVAE